MDCLAIYGLNRASGWRTLKGASFGRSDARGIGGINLTDGGEGKISDAHPL